ncbi:hypothetical protein HS041_29000 [Planomonospora sp. ID67723]|uniref:DUF6401 family natural product biosynthesis protein n=1 Tax=Planomonospora sp. ID67723 TaxID=2738134 RepID=UPI0018C3B72E|nr:DUF6401 family natural product biosynthesis protein [Planomonospora sp. ID67723]MBG0831758.1 hypothetical protein [Planomonospora sp. ID67723]
MSDQSWPARIRAEFAQWVLDLRAEHPGIGASLDQHIAAVRHALAGVGQHSVCLLAYLIGFWDGAHEKGWRAPQPGQPLDFAALRLSALCLMLETAPAS